MPNLLTSIHPFRVSGSRSLLTCRSEQQILCLLQGTHNNNYVGRYNFITFRIMSNPVGKTTKTSSKQVILQMHFICFSFQDMRSVKIWRDEFKAAENLLFTQAVARNGIVFWNCTGSQMRNHIPTLGTIWKFHVNIAYAQVTRSVVFNSCPNSR